MVDKICDYLTNKIRKQMPDVDDERAEIINYGMHLVIGEVPKIFIFIAIATVLGVLKEFAITLIVISPYRMFSGGFHLKTHFGCIIATTLLYCGIPFLAINISINDLYIKYIIIILVWIFGIIMCKLYAPADTENVPILSKKDTKVKQILSYITLTITLIIGAIIKNQIVSNIIILGMLIQSIMITKIAYRLTKTKYGYEVYSET